MQQGHGYRRVLLGRLTGDAGAYVHTSELGPCVPILTDTDACAEFVRPWLVNRHVRWVRGRIAIQVSLAELVSAGHAEAVVAAIRTVPSWRRAGLAWPHPVLSLAAAGDLAGARKLLEESARWEPLGPAQWEAAGVYWAVLFEDKAMARRCFELASAGWRQDDSTFVLSRASLAANWMRFCNDRDAALRALYQDVDTPILLDTTLDEARPVLLHHADAWMALFGNEKWAALHIECAGRIRNPRSIGFSGFLVALAWAGILGDETRAMEMAHEAMGAPHESSALAAMFWRCVANDPEKARACLWKKEWGQYDSERYRFLLARAIVMYGGGHDDAESIQRAESLIREVAAECPDDNLIACGVAEEWSWIMGTGAEDVLTRGAQDAQESCALVNLAESWLNMVHLDWDHRYAGCRAALEMAESLADNPLDYLVCAEYWKRLVADDAAAERCLVLAGEDDEPHDNWSAAKAWSNLLGRPAEARRLVLGWQGQVP